MNGAAAFLRLAITRLLARPGLLAVRFAGLLVTVTLVTAVALASAGVGDAMLQASVHSDALSRYLQVSDIEAPLVGKTYTAFDRYTRTGLAIDLGLPLAGRHVHHYTGTARVYRLMAGTALQRTFLALLQLHYYEGLRNQVKVVVGTLEGPDRAPNGDVAIAITTHTAQSLHLAVGARLVYAVHHGQRKVSPPMVVTAVVKPRDVNSTFWDDQAGQGSYRSLMMTGLGPFLSIAADQHVFSPDYFWSYTTDLRAVHLADAQGLLDRFARASARLSVQAPGSLLFTSLQDDVKQFLLRYALLPSILLVLVAPILALILHAVVIITALAVDQQTSVIVLMHSRGASARQLCALYTLESLVLGISAVIIGPAMALPLARLIGNASGFLMFSGGLSLHLRLTGQTYLLATGTALLGMVVALLPAVVQVCRSMPVFSQERARPSRKPLWQRWFLDLALLTVALYSLFVLTTQGRISSDADATAISQDPLIALAPLCFSMALSLIICRILPWLTGALLLLARHASSPVTYLALQRVARSPRDPMRLVGLCTLTLTLGVVAATVAEVEARNRDDLQRYLAGCDLRLEEFSGHQYTFNRPEQDIMTLSQHRALPSVRAVSPVLRYETSGNVVNSVNGTSVNVLGVDPASASRVLWFRSDFADQSFRRLLAMLTARGPNAIVSDSFVAVTRMRLGDSFSVILSNGVRVPLRLVATVHYFPTLDPISMPFIVSSLAYLQMASAAHGPNEVCMATDRNSAAFDRIMQITNSWPRQVVTYGGVASPFSAQAEPLTAGVYGVVSIGFLSAGMLALLGFFAYAYLSVQRRLGEFAIVRAMGLSVGGVRWLLLAEQFVLLGAGMLGGIGAGVLTAKLFLPYIPLATNTVPPFVVIMPWTTIGQFILAMLALFLVAFSIHVSLLLRRPLGRALRLGEG